MVVIAPSISLPVVALLLARPFCCSFCRCRALLSSMLQIASFRQLDRCLVGGEVTPVPGDLAQLVVQRLDRVGGVNDPSHHRREGQEGSESLPGVGEGPDRGRVALSELTGLEGLQGLPCGLLAGGLVDRPESRCHGLAVAVGHEPRGGPDQVDYACLDRRLGPGRLNRLGQPRQPVTFPRALRSRAGGAPSTIRTSLTPLLASSAHTCAQKEAPSSAWTQILKPRA